MSVSVVGISNGVLVNIFESSRQETYVVWQMSQAEVISNEYIGRDRTPRDIIRETIKFLDQEGCSSVINVCRFLAISRPAFIVFKQADPLAQNVLKMDTKLIWLRGQGEINKFPAEPKQRGEKTNTVVPLWRLAVTRRLACDTKYDNYEIK